MVLTSAELEEEDSTYYRKMHIRNESLTPISIYLSDFFVVAIFFF